MVLELYTTTEEGKKATLEKKESEFSYLDI